MEFATSQSEVLTRGHRYTLRTNQRNYLAIICMLMFSSNVAFGFTTLSWSNCFINKANNRIGDRFCDAVAMEKENCTFKTMRKRYTLFMKNNDFVGEQLDDDERSVTSNGSIESSKKEMNVKENDNAEFLLPGSKELSDFFSQPIVDVAQISLVLLSSLLVAVSTLQTLPVQVSDAILTVVDSIGAIFFFDFLMRWYSVGFKSSFLLNPLSIIDALFILPVLLRGIPTLAAALPSALSSSSGLINLRLLRILRLQLVLSDLDTFSNFQIALGLNPGDFRPYQLQLARVLSSLFTLLSVASGLIYSAEHDANPTGFPDYFTALYFGLTTLTTVGFGDIVPITFNGRLVVMGSIIAGVAIIPIQTASLLEALLDLQNERRNIDEVGENEKREIEQDVAQPYSSKKNIDTAGTIDGITKDDDIHLEHSLRICSCKICGADSHRQDALFCWRCGTKLSNTRNKVEKESYEMKE